MDQITVEASHAVAHDHIQYGATIIDYDIEFAPRKTLGICVNPDSSVCLKAPVDATLEQIQQKVHKRASWILKQKRFFESFGTSTTKRQYIRHKKDAGILLQTWYRQRANVKFQEYAQPIIEQFSVYGVKPQSLSIKKMDKRWGYCTIDGHITLNPRLICAPRCCIEYVITHELCHLIYRSHNKEFYALLTKEMPHWEKWKNKLERILM